MQRHQIYCVIFALFLVSYTTFSQDTNTVKINPITVTATRVPKLYSESARVVSIIDNAQIENAPVQSLPELLEFSSGVDVRQRGSFGVQSDISIRGGSFDQTMILLNGINITDAQTGHHNMNIPVDLESIDRIEILQGPGSRVFGPNAFSGAINIITKQKNNNNLSVNASGGEFGLYKTGLNGTIATENTSSFLAVSKMKSDGFIPNTDFDILNLYAKHKHQIGNSNLMMQIGHNNKEFGANSFYTPKYPNQFEHTRTSFASIEFETGSLIKFTPKIYYRRHQDRFELFRSNAPAWYTNHNYHLTHTYGGQANVSIISDYGISNFGLEYRTEHILSTNLGNDMSDKKDVPFEDNAVFNKEYTRNTTSIFLEHNLQISDFSLSGGAAFNYTKEYNTNLCGGIDLSYKAYDNLSYFLSLNNTMRMPTFTDLFYTGPSNIGNPDLLPEKAYTVESGIKYNNSVLRSTASVFVRKGKDLIDWIKENPEDTKWTTRNLTELTTVGFDISTYIYLSKTLNTFVPVNYLNISYTFTENSKSSEDYISYYVLDNLRHKLTLSLNHNLAFNIKADWKFSYQDRNGTYTKFNSVTLTPESEEPYNDLFILDAKLYLQQEYYTVYAEVSNILNNQVSDIPNVAIPGRWLKVGINTDLDL